MGERISRPIKFPILFSRTKNSENNVENNVIHSSTVDSKNEILQSICDHNWEIVNGIYNEYFRNIDISNNISENNLYPRSNRKRPIDKDDNEENAKFQKLEIDSDIKFFTEKYSLEELVKILKECLSSNEYVDLPNDLEDNAKLKSIDEILRGKDEYINSLTKDELETLFQQKLLFRLSENKKLATKLKLVLDNAARHQILKFIDDVDENSNYPISIALLNSNLEAFCHLIKKRAKIPKFIYLNNTKIPFLNYIAMNGKIRTNNFKIDYILPEILITLINDYGKSKITKYLCQIDSNSGLSLPHLLLILYQFSPDLRTHITSCLKLCIDYCPESLQIMCASRYCSSYKFNVIAHSIILPETNYEIIQEFMNLKKTQEELLIYRNLVEVHLDTLKQHRLLEIINSKAEKQF